MNKLKILVFVSSRSDYSLIKWIFINKNNLINFDLIVSYVEDENKLLSNIVEKDKNVIYEKINIEKPTNNLSRSRNIIKIINKTSKTLSKKKYDFFLILGDRYEVFSSAIASNNFQIPIIHLSGGLLSMGSQDEFYRHAITKLATYHFTTSKKSRQRVIQMGEHPSKVFNYGSLGVEALKNIIFISKKNIKKKFGVNLMKNCILITVHPNTEDKSIRDIDIILKTLKKIDNASLIFTSPNFDPGYKYIISQIKKFLKNKSNSLYFDCLTDQDYLSIMKFSQLVLGNSSSGFYQAPFLRVPSLNIGNRQKGREKPNSVIDVKLSTLEIYKQSLMILEKKKNINFKNFPYGNGNTSKKIISQILKLPRDRKIKNFFNINY